MQNRWEDEQDQKICAFDVDGVLNYYPDPWVEFINRNSAEKYRDLNDAKRNIPYQLYRDLKYEYRESGVKANLKVRAGAKETLKELKHMGYTILIITSRPFEEHKSLFKQTTDWLSKNKLPYDGIIFGKNKYVEVLTKAPNLRFLVDDHRYYANSVARWNYKAFLVDNQYNQGYLENGVYRIKDLREILDYEFVRY